jgi:hypothetical protein
MQVQLPPTLDSGIAMQNLLKHFGIAHKPFLSGNEAFQDQLRISVLWGWAAPARYIGTLESMKINFDNRVQFPGSFYRC